MLYENNKVTKILKIKYPIVQAPMIWLTNAKLVSSISNAGALGVLGPNAGQNTIVRSPFLTGKRMKEEIIKTKKLTKKPFAVNIVLPYENSRDFLVYSDEILKVSLEENIKYFVVSGNINERYFSQIKKNNGIIIYRPLTPTVECVKKAEDLGVDLLVATGYDEGGILPKNSFGTFTIVPTIVDAVKIPVLAAGGINDHRGVKAAFALGAEGVFVGTRFIITKESPASESIKNKIINSNCEDLVNISGIYRSLYTKKINEIQKNMENGNNVDLINMNALCLGFLSEKFYEKGIVSVNTGINLIKDIPTTAELIKRLIKK